MQGSLRAPSSAAVQVRLPPPSRLSPLTRGRLAPLPFTVYCQSTPDVCSCTVTPFPPVDQVGAACTTRATPVKRGPPLRTQPPALVALRLPLGPRRSTRWGQSSRSAASVLSHSAGTSHGLCIICLSPSGTGCPAQRNKLKLQPPDAVRLPPWPPSVHQVRAVQHCEPRRHAALVGGRHLGAHQVPGLGGNGHGSRAWKGATGRVRVRQLDSTSHMHRSLTLVLHKGHAARRP